MRAFFTLILCLTILCAGQLTHAEPRRGYVSDLLILTFRQGPGPSYQVLKTLESNTPLTILEEENGYFKVRLSSEETGWVDKQFVMFDTPKTQIIAQLEQENQTLKKQLENLTAAGDSRINQLSSRADSAQEETQAFKAALKKAEERIDTLTKQLAASQKQYTALAQNSENLLKVMEKNKVLKEQNNLLSRDMALLEQQSGQVLKTGMIKWFLAGFGVIFLGWILGQSVSSKRQKKNSLLS